MSDPLVGGGVTVVLSLALVIALVLPLQREVDQLRRDVAELRGDQPAPPVSVFTRRLGVLHRLIHRGRHRTAPPVPAPPPTSPRSPT